MKKILIVEDDFDAAHILRTRLENAGYACDIAYRGDTGLAQIMRSTYHGAIVDLSLPGMSGSQLIRQARIFGLDIPIIILTADTEEVTLVNNLGRGANDFITKPYRIGELLCRLETRLAEHHGSESTIQHRELSFDTISNTVTYDDRYFVLPPTEAAIFQLLLRSRGRMTSLETIMRRVWGPDADVQTKTVTRTISRLNAILEAYGLANIISNKRDIGYVIA